MHTALSLFSGCGGFCEGVESASFEVRAAVELDRFACETSRFNFPRTPLFEGDIHDFMMAESDHARKYQLEKGVDLVFGGPPCQGYSQIGTRRLDDERNLLYREFLRIVTALRPRVFLMENVPNLALLNRGYFRRLILSDCRHAGYGNSIMLRVSAADFGVPQTRQRVIFVGIRDEDFFPFELTGFCEASLSGQMAKPYVTVREAIGDLPAEIVPSGKTMKYPDVHRPSSFMQMMRLDFDGGWYKRSLKRRRGIGSGEPVLFNHHTKEIQERRKNLIALLAPGMKADSLPREIWDGKRPEKWRRLHPDQPSYTILAQMHRDLSEWVHPWLERWITVREAARLQSFHDGFIFRGSEWQQLKQIGNAVPPLLAHALGGLAKDLIGVLDQDAKSRVADSRVTSAVQQLLPV
jgi:DNA (cytosine-5)-methyltransferase 1